MQKLRRTTAEEVRMRLAGSAHPCFTNCVEPPAGFGILYAFNDIEPPRIPDTVAKDEQMLGGATWDRLYSRSNGYAGKVWAYPSYIPIALPLRYFEDAAGYRLHEDEGG